MRVLLEWDRYTAKDLELVEAHEKGRCRQTQHGDCVVSLPL